MKDENIQELMEQLKFHGMARIFDETMVQATQEGWSVPHTLELLFKQEVIHRKERSMEYRLFKAKIPNEFSLSTFPFEKRPQVRKSQIMNLADLSFIQQGINIVFVGPPGAGKTGLATGLLRNAIMSGYRGLFAEAQSLLNDLYASMADQTTSKLLRRLIRYDILLIDELTYLTLNQPQMNCFFRLISERYVHNRSTIITTNADFSSWYDIFSPKHMVDVLLDRIKHRCIKIPIQVDDSLREPLYEC